MARVIAGDAAAWLASRRGELNSRFERMRSRFPAMTAEAVLGHLADILPPLAGPEPASGDLLSSVYDLVLLHAGRDAFASRPCLDLLLRQLFPKIRRLLIQRPSAVPGALSNAVENLGALGPAFVAALGPVADSIDDHTILLDAVAVLAWRLGEARLRETALSIAQRLPARVLLTGLGLADWPDAAASLVLEDLRTTGWRHPTGLFTESSLQALRDPQPGAVAALKTSISAATASPLRSWTVSARVGDFSGFAGNFDTPPVVLDGGDRHQLFARCGAQDFRIDADAFGWVCRPHHSMDLPVRTVDDPSALRRLVARLQSTSADRLLPDGTLTIAGDSARLPALSGAVSFTVRPSLVATTHADSHRIRIATPPCLPL